MANYDDDDDVEDFWIVEIVLDTGQRYQSVDLASARAAALEADDMASRTSVVAVTMIQLATGEAITKPSRNLMAGRNRFTTDPRAVLAEALDRAA